MQIKIYKPSGGGFFFDSWEMYIFDTNNDLIGSTNFDGLALDTVHTVNIPLTMGSFDIDRILGDQFLYNDGPQIRCILFT